MAQAEHLGWFHGCHGGLARAVGKKRNLSLHSSGRAGKMLKVSGWVGGWGGVGVGEKGQHVVIENKKFVS